MLLNGFTSYHSPTASKLLIFFAVCDLRVRPCSSTVLRWRQMQLSVAVRESSWFVHYAYSTKVSSLALAVSGMIMWNRSSTFTTQNLLGIWNVPNSRTRLFFNVFLAPKSTIPKTAGSALCTLVLLLCNYYHCLDFWALRRDARGRTRIWQTPIEYHAGASGRAVRLHLYKTDEFSRGIGFQ